jgi:hypothetical protein
MYQYLYIYIYICMENGTNGKCKFVFLGRQTIYGNRRLLFQQMCPSMPVARWCIATISRLCTSRVHVQRYSIACTNLTAQSCF